MYEILLRNVYLLITLSVVANAAVIAYGVCVNPRNEKGICIQIRHCNYLLGILNKTTVTELDPADQKFLKDSQCGQDSSQESLAQQVLVCCPNSYRSDPNESEKTEPGNVLPEPGVCGDSLTNRIYGGSVTKLDEFPWMALLQYKTGPDSYSFYCGGSLINSRYVLTAAHCLKHPAMPTTWELYSVRLGEWDIDSNPDCVLDVRNRKECADPPKDVLVEYAIAHPAYEPASKEQFNDIALVRLSKGVKTTEYIMPICLPLAASFRTNQFISNLQWMLLAGEQPK
ncbi:hypothetical protein DOY81_009061 [Sarcophaga bullata]|nr:hypothetical protein DOY81_009061 [Sarcophaga bullata]